MELAKIMGEKRVSLARTLLPIFVNVPVFILFSATLRKMAEKTLFAPELPFGLFGCCLSLADPYVTAGLVVFNAVALEIGRRTLPANTSRNFKMFLGMFGHTLNIISFWILSSVPSVLLLCLSLGYWAVYQCFEWIHVD